MLVTVLAKLILDTLELPNVESRNTLELGITMVFVLFYLTKYQPWSMYSLQSNNGTNYVYV